MRNAILFSLFAAFLTLVAACGPGMMPGDDGSTGESDAVVNTDTATSPDAPPTTNCRPAIDTQNPGDTSASACTSNDQCCSGTCWSTGVCYPSDLGGKCSTDRDCDRYRGVCMGGRCGLMDPGAPCVPGSGDRMCPGGNCSPSTRVCMCGDSSNSCMRNEHCCSGSCFGASATQAGRCD